MYSFDFSLSPVVDWWLRQTRKELLLKGSMVAAIVIVTAFAFMAYFRGEKLNAATWLMTFLLDLVGLWLLYLMMKKEAVKNNAKPERPYLQAAWTIAGGIVFLAVCAIGDKWEWTWVEFSCVTFAGVATLVKIAVEQYLPEDTSFTISGKTIKLPSGEHCGLYCYILGTVVAFIPQGLNYYSEPQVWTWWLWGGCFSACVAAILGAPERTQSHLLMPYAFSAMNIVLLALNIYPLAEYLW